MGKLERCQTCGRPLHKGRPDEKMQQPKSFGVRCLSQHEVDSLLRACNGRLRNIVLFALNTGILQMDILSLMWSQVDLDYMEIEIKGLILPLNETAINILKDRLEKANKSGCVFTSGNGHIISSRNINHALRTASRKAGINTVRLYDLRNDFAARLFEAGVDGYVIGRLLGHKTAGTPVRPLCAIAELMRQAVEALDEMSLDDTDKNKPSSE